MTSEQIPFYIGRYKVTGQLGAGGMGVVYLATDERLNRRVAVKRLLKNPNSGSAHLRIRQEALLLAQLNHSNIVQIYDVVEEGGDVALVMEYVDGCTLSRWQRERNPSLRQKILLLKQLCDGLARAHGAGIIHRDLKADNILIDSDNTPKITDFGIAKNWREHSDLTREQHIAGSWGAMSPEQALGNPLDNRCDLFALGMLAYRLLCGQNPFGDCESPFAAVDRIVHSQHPPAAKLNPELPPALCQLLDRLLAKNPDKRPLNAAAVAQELDAILMTPDIQSTGTASRTVTITAENFHRSQRRRGRLYKIFAGTALAGDAALLVAAAAALLPEAQRETAGEYIAIVAPDERGLANRETRLLANNVLSAIKQGLSNREGLFLVPYAESEQLRGRPLREQARALNAQLLLHPELSCAGAHCEVSLDLIDTESFSVTASRSTALEIDQSLDSRARTLQQLHYLLPQYPPLRQEPRFDISDADYQRYLDLFEQGHDRRSLAQTLSGLKALRERAPGFLPIYELYGELSIEHFFDTRDPQILQRLEELLRQAPASLAGAPELQTAQFQLDIQQSRMEEAKRILDRLDASLPDRASYYRYEANYFHVQGEYERALEAIDRALALRPSNDYQEQKALSLLSLGEMAAAKAQLREVLARDNGRSYSRSLLAAIELDDGNPQETIRLLGDAGVDTLGGMDTFNLCLAYYIERRYQPAFDCLQQSVALAPKDPEPLLYQAQIARLRGQPQSAQQLARKALALTVNREDWEGQLMYARAQAELGNSGEAIETLLKIRRRAPDNLYVNYARSQVYIASGDLLSAEAHIRKTLQQGQSLIWFKTPQFDRICALDNFARLRADYPELCIAGEDGTRIAQK